MFLLFLALALVPALLLVIVPTIMRIQAEQQSIRSLESSLRTKAETIFTGLVENKAGHYEQILAPRVSAVRRLAQSTRYHLESGSRLNNPALKVELAWQAEHDPAVRSVFVISSNSADALVYPAGERDVPAAQRAIDTSAIDIAVWSLQFFENRSVLTVVVPIFLNGAVQGAAGMDLWVDVLVNEVPRYGIADQGTLLLLDKNGIILAVPDWGRQATTITRLKGTPERLAGLPFTEVADPSATGLDNLSFGERMASRQTEVFASNLANTPVYIATRRVGETPLRVVLLLPLEEVFNRASYYGASFQATTLSILTQALISALGFILVIGIGALFTLRKLARPVQLLTSAARAIAAGQLNTRVPEIEKGEMQELASAFNQMSSAIQSTQEDLQAKQAELAEALATRQEEFRVINATASLTNTTADLPKKLTAVLDILCQSLNLEHGLVVISDESGQPFDVAQSTPGNNPLPPALQKAEYEAAWLALKQGEVGLQNLEGFQVLAVPVQIQSQTIGALGLICACSRSLGDSTRTFLHALSTHIAILIQSAQLQSQARYRVIAEERRRMARELHDAVTQSIFSLSLAAESLKNSKRFNSDEQSRLDFIIAQARQIRTEMRSLINELRPIDLESNDLEEALRSHCESIRRISGIEVDARFEGNLVALPLSVKHHLNRIVQEALSNVARHSHASRVTVNLQAGESEVLLTVQDDGSGFTPGDGRSSGAHAFGLISMRERTETLGGGFDLQSAPGRGVVLTIRIPLNLPVEVIHV